MTSGSGPMARRLAAYRAGQPPCTSRGGGRPARVSPALPGWGAGGPGGPGTTKTVPGWMTSGSGPRARRLAAYRAGQPPRTAAAAAMPDSVSPGWTTYRAPRRGAAAGAGTAVGGSGAVTMGVMVTWVML